MYLSAHGKNEKVAHKHADLPISQRRWGWKNTRETADTAASTDSASFYWWGFIPSCYSLQEALGGLKSRQGSADGE